MAPNESETSKDDNRKLAIAKRIRSFRKRLGLTQHQFASELGVETSTVSRWELVKASPSLQQTEKMHDLGRRRNTPPWLFDEHERGRGAAALADDDWEEQARRRAMLFAKDRFQTIERTINSERSDPEKIAYMADLFVEMGWIEKTLILARSQLSSRDANEVMAGAQSMWSLGKNSSLDALRKARDVWHRDEALSKFLDSLVQDLKKQSARLGE